MGQSSHKPCPLLASIKPERCALLLCGLVEEYKHVACPVELAQLTNEVSYFVHLVLCWHFDSSLDTDLQPHKLVCNCTDVNFEIVMFAKRG